MSVGRTLLVVLLAMALAGCMLGDETDEGITTSGPPPAASPEAAVEELLDALTAEDYARAAELSVEDQMILVALAEGVSVAEALVLIEAGADQVGANFWEGFASGLEEFLGRPSSSLEVAEGESFTAEGRSFSTVDVGLGEEDEAVRRFTLQQRGGWRVDVIATFAPALAGKLKASADLARSHPDGQPLVELMRRQEPSLHAVLAQPGISPELQQAVIAAIEVIRR